MTETAAERCADRALERAVIELADSRTRQLRIARGKQPGRRVATDWVSRCAELAAQDLPEDHSSDAVALAGACVA
ncbi:hypothetical protein ACFQ78_27225 [Streptomyces sp. NPDC056519]|uniref:hypothetical protein n=1 Tax=Streptomyces sp. NPDC056519 TaxID=3345849 RepID=UPI0036A16E99